MSEILLLNYILLLSGGKNIDLLVRNIIPREWVIIFHFIKNDIIILWTRKQFKNGWYCIIADDNYYLQSKAKNKLHVVVVIVVVVTLLNIKTRRVIGKKIVWVIILGRNRTNPDRLVLPYKSICIRRYHDIISTTVTPLYNISICVHIDTANNLLFHYFRETHQILYV